MTLDEFGLIALKGYYARKRRMKRGRKANPSLKHSPLHSLLKGQTKFTGPLRIRLPADYNVSLQEETA